MCSGFRISRLSFEISGGSRIVCRGGGADPRSEAIGDLDRPMEIQETQI